MMAGDTPDSAMVAGHLAGCPACLDELGRLRRTATLVRLALHDRDRSAAGPSSPAASPAAATAADEAALPALPPELRERTLAFVREFGVQRPLRVAAPSTGAGFIRPAAWLASIAAALIVAVIGTSLVLGGARRDDETADLTRLAAWSIDVAHAPDAHAVSLVSPAGGRTAGLLAFAPSTGELVVSVHDLAPAPAGKEYRCWMEVAGQRTIVGRMFFAGGIAYWVGAVGGLAEIPSGTRFGVTLVDAVGTSVDGDPVIVGSL